MGILIYFKCVEFCDEKMSNLLEKIELWVYNEIMKYLSKTYKLEIKLRS